MTTPTQSRAAKVAHNFPLKLGTRNRDEQDKNCKRPAWESIVLRDFRDVTIARIYQDAPNAEKYAAFIVRACNSHEALVATLEAVVNSGPLNNGLRDENTMAIARAALQQAAQG